MRSIDIGFVFIVLRSLIITKSFSPLHGEGIIAGMVVGIDRNRLCWLGSRKWESIADLRCSGAVGPWGRIGDGSGDRFGQGGSSFALLDNITMCDRCHSSEIYFSPTRNHPIDTIDSQESQYLFGKKNGW